MELLKATDNFSQANIVGCGGFGLVYKATLANGTKLAVKKLSGDFGLMEREFKSEIEALSTAQHENLVSLQGYCVHNGFRLLIYSYMENGSLEGASFGLAYMHQVCEPHIVHRDIKSSNILLDEKFEAHVVYQMRSEGKQEQIFDPVLRDKGYEDEMLQMLDVACMCVSHNPRKRPSIQEVVDCLKNIGSSSSPQKEQNND
ncbi:Tyrosine-sulfated glycopeptide receptor 1 [Linum grandiflorum]